MPYVYSTLSCDQKYTNYRDTSIAGGANLPSSAVLIKGGANVAQKKFISDEGTNTPEGVVTHVTDAQYDELCKNSEFLAHEERGFIIVIQEKLAVAEVVEDMVEKDASAQYTAEDYEAGGRAATAGAKPPVVGDAEEESLSV